MQTTLDLSADEGLDEMIAAQEQFLNEVGFETGNVQGKAVGEIAGSQLWP